MQLSIMLPANVVATITSSATAVLELWAGNKLVCSSLVLLVPASRAAVAAELIAWEQVSLALRVARRAKQTGLLRHDTARAPLGDW